MARGQGARQAKLVEFTFGVMFTFGVTLETGHSEIRDDKENGNAPVHVKKHGTCGYTGYTATDECLIMYNIQVGAYKVKLSKYINNKYLILSKSELRFSAALRFLTYLTLGIAL